MSKISMIFIFFANLHLPHLLEGRSIDSDTRQATNRWFEFHRYINWILVLQIIMARGDLHEEKYGS